MATKSLADHAGSIAIVGMGCRLPGGSSSTSKLWDMLAEGRSGQGELPESRFNAAAFFHKDAQRAATINGTGGYFLQHDIRLFDNAFFGINNLEAKYMDPQQRQLLEVVFECLESAGAALDQVSGANIGCYVANFTADFVTIQAKSPELFHRYSATGFGPTILANRISHCFNLQGPSLVLDTACSSSLYALHVACAALNAGECDAAIVAGANLVQSPETYIAMAKAGVLSGTSTSHTFDISADGYGRGEGVAALYLKRYSTALVENDPIRSIIRGSAVNSNGHTPGITLPSVDGQEAVIRKAYSMARLETNETTYVEAHGTGTPIGDPIEVEALAKVFRPTSGRKLLLGSVKTNIGHGGAVSGLSSVIKATLALEHKTIPATVGILQVNPQLKLGERDCEVVTELQPWPQGTVERISVNSFGYGGANAHVIIDSAQSYSSDRVVKELSRGSTCYSSFILPFSAKCPNSLARVMDATVACQIPSSRLQDMAYTLVSRRSGFSYRGYIVGSETDQVAHFATRAAQSSQPVTELPCAFVFTGQGAQWPRMAAELLQRFPIYRETIESLDTYLGRLQKPPEWKIKDIIQQCENESFIDKAAYSQPVCTAVQIGLVELLRAWDIQPSTVIGHSSGEIAAAFAAEILTSKEAIAVAYYRGLVASEHAVEGAMMAVGLGSEIVSKEISRHGFQQELKIACINSEESTTVSGRKDAIDRFLEILTNRGIFVRKLKTDGKAYHSHHMEAIGQSYEDLLSKVFQERQSNAEQDTGTKMFSTVNTKAAEKCQIATAKYWRSNLESPVLFKEAMQSLLLTGPYHLIEIGPHPALRSPLRDIREKAGDLQSRYFSSLSRGRNSELSILDLVGTLYLNGHRLKFSEINNFSMEGSQLKSASSGDQSSEHICAATPYSCCASKHICPRVLHDLPSYAWQYGEPLWHESRISSEYRNLQQPRHELLGSRIPGAPGVTACWRNILKVEEVPWLQDHKLGRTMVFPAAGYVGMAIEGLLQLRDSPTESIITLRQVHLKSFLALEPGKDNVEVSLQLEPATVSSLGESNIWWRFAVSSYAASTTTVHATGFIASTLTSKMRKIKLPQEQFLVENKATRTWYNRLAKERLCFGPQFQSLTDIGTDRKKGLPLAIAKTTFREAMDGYSRYKIHPITLDAILQTAIVASSMGDVQCLHGKIPVTIGELDVTSSLATSPLEPCTIHGTSQKIGFEAVLLGGDLQNSTGKTIAHLQGVRAVPYEENSLRIITGTMDRSPALRILWKPDVSMIGGNNPHALKEYMEKFVSLLPFQVQPPSLAYLLAAIDLVTHKNWRMRVLELTNESDSLLEDTLYQTSIGSQPRRFESYTRSTLLDEADLRIHENHQHANPEALRPMAQKESSTKIFDLVIIPGHELSNTVVNERFESLARHMAPGASMILVHETETDIHLEATRFDVITATPDGIGSSISVARSISTPPPNPSLAGSHIILVRMGDEDPLSDALEAALPILMASKVTIIHLEAVSSESIPIDSIVVATVEARKPLLAVLTPIQMSGIKRMAENASVLLWITGGGLYKARHPEFGLVLGLARSLMLERPSLRVPVLDIDDQEDLKSTCANIAQVLRRAVYAENPDLEYRQYRGVLYNSRFIQDIALNARFRKIQSTEAEETSITGADSFKLAIKHIGRLDSLCFEIKDQTKLKPGYIEVQVKVVGVNAKDFYALSGKSDMRDSTCALEFTGVVSMCYSHDSKFAIGDRVVVMAPNSFATVECVPEWACCKLEEHESFEVMATVPLVFSTALYALEYRARLQPHQSILIHSAAGGAGMAAIQIAQLIGAEIYATVGTTEKKDYLVKTFNIREDHIFSSHDASFLPKILEATFDRGVDVILNSLAGNLLHESWKACAEFGTFVEIGKKDISEGGELDMQVFKKATTFTAFDLTDLYWSESETQRQTWHRLLHRSMALLRGGKIRHITPLKIFPASDVVQAFRYFSSAARIGKIAISFQTTRTISAVPKKYCTALSAHKAYLLIGCLGGLGRSLTRWMWERGARNFIFISRSGTEKPAAKQLIDDLEKDSASLVVVRGDVARFEVVERAISHAALPIGGVVQAAMSIHVALFDDMSYETWHAGIEQKVRGAWNVHKALQGKDDKLDFFLMLSSITGSVGTATESNYCAANAFLDAFGCYRRSLGLPAVSLGLGMISEVGFLHENPDIEAALLRKGVQPFTEDEMLQIVDSALTPPPPETISATDNGIGARHFMDGHILTGLELHGFQRIRDMGYMRGTTVLEDPRCSSIAGAFAKSTSSAGEIEQMNSGHGYPQNVAAALAENESTSTPGDTLIEAVHKTLAGRLATLLLVPASQLEIHKHLTDFGMESMLAAELRADLFKAFKVDVAFTILLDGRTLLKTVAVLIGCELLKRKQRS